MSTAQNPTAEKVAENPLAGLQPGRIVIHTDHVGVERVGIVGNVMDAEGTVNLVVFAKFEGEAPTILERNVRYKPTTGQTAMNGWRWPDRGEKKSP